MKVQLSRVLGFTLLVVFVTALNDWIVYAWLYEANASFIDAVLAGEEITSNKNWAHIRALKFANQVSLALNVVLLTIGLHLLKGQGFVRPFFIILPAWIIGVFLGRTILSVNPIDSDDLQAMFVSILASFGIASVFCLLNWIREK